MERLVAVDYAMATANQPGLMEMWTELVNKIGKHGSHPLLSGYCTRLLRIRISLDARNGPNVELLHVSREHGIRHGIWFEGFLKSSGTILLLDDQLWGLVNSWLATLNDGSFMELLPILRQNFQRKYSLPERRKLGEKAKELLP